METGNGVGGGAQGVPGAMREKGPEPEWSLGLGTGTWKPGMREGRLSILMYTGTVSFLSSEFSNALEYLKLLNSFVDSVGIVTPPFSSSSVLKSALGKRPQVSSAGLVLPDSLLPGTVGPSGSGAATSVCWRIFSF